MKSFSFNKNRLRYRYFTEKLFRYSCISSVLIVFAFLIILSYSVFSRGIGSLWQTYVIIPIEFSEKIIDPQGKRFEDPSVLSKADYGLIARNALVSKLGLLKSKQELLLQVDDMISSAVRFRLRNIVLVDPSLVGKTVKMPLLVSSKIDSAFKGYIDFSTPETNRRISDYQLKWFKQLVHENALSSYFNYGFFINGNSTRAEAAGIGVAIVGSIYMMLIVVGLSLPLGIASAIYLEEFAPKNLFSNFIQVNINNLASVPSVVYGLLGSSMLINFFKMPRSTPLVGGLILALMTLPNIVISTGLSLRTVPSSIRSAALGLGSSKVQTVFHHVLPLAMPVILTGSIVSLARALGETAPLLFIGMVAFITDYPDSILDTATALPVQIYLWADDADKSFFERTFGSIMILLLFLVIINIAMLFLRNRFRKRF
ncbi:phosphate ABC transporter permease PstA [Candidatus Liberibacter americanus]|uniref:Phosphate transport system permease protein PstA n=1 Tax=Candidatus Liberibacter americanus str. Sao Paulo TaxID=1261131 RepID=U6B3I0_9HYPH|nr:phosphate ABC transporter permease PstA [Candidatus Liberibacter americanus]AHA27619.1 Phosphate transport system permease protein PstA [Candidatus Liberibacter americanus str. Sao Paulo]